MEEARGYSAGCSGNFSGKKLDFVMVVERDKGERLEGYSGGKTGRNCWWTGYGEWNRAECQKLFSVSLWLGQWDQ